MLRDYCSACREDCAFQDDRNARIWFKPLDRREQEGTEDYDRRVKKEGD
jgi:hypothetical protein